MEKEKSTIESGMSNEESLSEPDKSHELHEAMTGELSWISDDYWKVINSESESDEEITKKDIYKANLSDIEKRFDKNSREYIIFQALRKKGLKIYINPKTDVSYTDRYNIIRGLGPITEQSKTTMELGSDTPDETVYMTKLIHEMGHSTLRYNTENQEDKVYNILTVLISLRNENNIPLTKLGSINRYDTNEKKANEDCVEFIRMYIQNPSKFKEYLKSIISAQSFKEARDPIKAAENAIIWIYAMIENFAKNILDNNMNIDQ